MKAQVLREINVPLEVEEIEVDNPGPREVLVRTRASGVCHSDLHYVEGSYNIPKPAVLGHEAAGTIEAVGDQVTYVKRGRPGDYVPVRLLRAVRVLPAGATLTCVPAPP